MVLLKKQTDSFKKGFYMKTVVLFCVLFSSVCFGGECKNGKCFLNKSESSLVNQKYTSSMPVIESKKVSTPVTTSCTVCAKKTTRRVRFFRWIRRR